MARRNSTQTPSLFLSRSPLQSITLLNLLKNLVFLIFFLPPSSVTLPNPIRYIPAWIFFSFLSLGCLHGGALGSDALSPHAAQEMHQCLMAHRLLLRYCVCVMLLSLGSALVGMSLMFYSGVRQVKVSPGHHPCNSPGWNIRVTKPLAPHGGSETGKHADRMAIPALYPCPCQAETVREVAGRGGADVFIFNGVARKTQIPVYCGVSIYLSYWSQVTVGLASISFHPWWQQQQQQNKMNENGGFSHRRCRKKK